MKAIDGSKSFLPVRLECLATAAHGGVEFDGPAEWASSHHRVPRCGTTDLCCFVMAVVVVVVPVVVVVVPVVVVVVPVVVVVVIVVVVVPMVLVPMRQSSGYVQQQRDESHIRRARDEARVARAAVEARVKSSSDTSCFNSCFPKIEKNKKARVEATK